MGQSDSKRCDLCQEELPLASFWRLSSGKDGYQPRCKECQNACRRARRAAPTAQAVARRKAAEIVARAAISAAGVKKCSVCGDLKKLSNFSKHDECLDGYYSSCSVCRRPSRSAYYQANRADILAANAEYHAANHERVREVDRAYQAANFLKRREHEGRRRARKRTVPAEPIDLALLWTGTCGICGERMDPDLKYPHPKSRSLDHIVPLARGGAHVQSNVQYACLDCNIRKGAKTT